MLIGTALDAICATPTTPIYVPPHTDPQGFVEVMRNYANQFGVDLIIPVTDEVILPLSKTQTGFDGPCEIAIATSEHLGAGTDKLKMVRKLQLPGVHG